jgi:hypothetical protein
VGMIWEIPESFAATGDLRPGDELWAESTRDGVIVRSDSLRKVYVEATGRCNLHSEASASLPSTPTSRT